MSFSCYWSKLNQEVSDVFVFRVAFVIKQSRPKISIRSKRFLPSLGGLSGFNRSALKSLGCGSGKLTLAWNLEGSLCNPCPSIILLRNSSLETETRQYTRFRVIPYCMRRSRTARNLSLYSTFVWPTTRMSSKRNLTSCRQAPLYLHPLLSGNRLKMNQQKGVISVVSLRLSRSRSTWWDPE